MYHHVALATKDIRKAHHFYTEAMGFTMVKVVKRKAPGGGWTKHIFYDMGDGSLFAIWDLRGIEGVQLQSETWKSAMSTGLGLPWWVNHLAFKAKDIDDYESHRQRWLTNGYHVSEVDHEFIRSLYTFDPDGTMVEWTLDVELLNDADRREAEALLNDDTPATQEDYTGTMIRSKNKKWSPEIES